MGKKLHPVRFVVAHSGTDVVYDYPWALENSGRFVRGYIEDAAGVTANDTNYVTFSVECNGTEVASEATTTTDLGNITAGTPVAIAQTSGALVDQGELVELLITKTGTGVTIGGTVTLLFEEVRT